MLRIVGVALSSVHALILLNLVVHSSLDVLPLRSAVQQMFDVRVYFAPPGWHQLALYYTHTFEIED